MTLSIEERQAFLAEPRIASLAVRRDEARGPLIVPVWFHYEPGGEPWIVTYGGSYKAQLIDAAGRFTLMVDRVEPSLRHVSVEGPVVRSTATDAEVREVTARYLAPEAAEQFVADTWAVADEQVVYRMKPERWIGQDLGPLPGMLVTR